MKPEYDFTKARKNPYAKLFKRQVTIRLDEEVDRHFKSRAEETGLPNQSLILFRNHSLVHPGVDKR